MHQLFALTASVFAVLGVPQQGNAQVGLAHEVGEELPSSPGLSIRVDEGRAPGREGLRISLEGAAANSTALLAIGSPVGAGLGNCRTQLVRTNSEGRASVSHFGPLPAGLAVRFAAPGAGGALQRSSIAALPSSGGYASGVPQRGDIVISEIMKDPVFVTDTHGEWFELQNLTNHPINIAGWKISDLGTNTHTLSNNGQLILLLPGQRFVLGNDKDPLTNGGVQVDYKYSNFTLGNGADSIILTARRGDIVDQVDYDDGIFWPDVPGKSLTLDPFAGDVYLNDDPVNWCPASSLLGGGNTDSGTPMLDNDDCP